MLLHSSRWSRLLCCCSLQLFGLSLVPISGFSQCTYASFHRFANLRVDVCLSFRCFCLAAEDSNFFVPAFHSSLPSALFHALCLRAHRLSSSSYLSRLSCSPNLSSSSQFRLHNCGILIMSNSRRGRTSLVSASDNLDLTLLPDPPDPQLPAGESDSPPSVQPRRSKRVSRAVVGRHLNQTYHTPIQPPSELSCLHISLQQADILANPGGLSRSTRRSTTSARTTRVVPSTPISTMANAARSSAGSLQILCKKPYPTYCSSLDLPVTDYDPDAPFEADTIRVANKTQSDSQNKSSQPLQDESSQPPQDSAPQTQPEVVAPLPSSQSLTGVAPSTGVPIPTTGPLSTGPRNVPDPVDTHIAPSGTQSLSAGATLSIEASFDETGRPIPPTPDIARLLADMAPARIVKRIYQVGSGWTVQSFATGKPRPSASAMQAKDLCIRQRRADLGLDPGPPLSPAFLTGYERSFARPGTAAGSSD